MRYGISKFKFIFITLFLLCSFSCTKKAAAETMSASFVSSVVEVGASPVSIDWNDDVPLGTSITMQVRAGRVPVPDLSWTSWTAVSKGGSLVSFNGNQYLQYKATFSNDGTAEPSLYEVIIFYEGGKPPFFTF